MLALPLLCACVVNAASSEVKEHLRGAIYEEVQPSAAATLAYDLEEELLVRARQEKPHVPARDLDDVHFESSEELLKTAKEVERRGLAELSAKKRAARAAESAIARQAKIERRKADELAWAASQAQASKLRVEKEIAESAKREEAARQQKEDREHFLQRMQPIVEALEPVSTFVKKNLAPEVLARRIGDNIAKKREEEREEKTKKRAEEKRKADEKLIRLAKQQVEEMKKQDQEDQVIRAREEKAKERMAAEGRAREQERKTFEALTKQKTWARYHYAFAPAGQDCPEAWAPVTTLPSCKIAQSVLGGVDNLNYKTSWEDRPGGCFLHFANWQINFNPNVDIGKLNVEDQRVCELMDESEADTIPGRV